MIENAYSREGDSMVETVVEVGLPVNEKLTIRKNRIEPENVHPGMKRFCVVTGIHGDELEGQYVCCELNRILSENRGLLDGIVDIYPALNPLGINTISRGIPMFDLDMNKIFDGSDSGAMAEYVASKVAEDISGADMCVDIHASNIFLREIPQVRINDKMADELLPYARLVNADYIWVGQSPAVEEASLAYYLNSIGIKTIVVEMGVGMRITKDYCEQLLTGIFRLMYELGIWKGECPQVRKPIISTDGEITILYADTDGIFMPCVEHWKGIKKGAVLGRILDPLTGKICEEIISPVDGMVVTLREYPVVTNGSLVGRVLGGDH